MSILSIENLVKTYGEKTLFDHISFTIAEKQRIGLIGVNGTGKSTLLKVIAGLESPEEGQVVHANQFRLEYLPQQPEFDEDLSVLDEVYYGDSPLIRMMREYEETVVELENNPGSEALQKRLTAMQQRMDDNHAWEAMTVAKMILTRLGIKDFSQRVKDLSGGQKKRVALAKALIHPADLLILDEPTNHLDHDIIEWLEGYLPQYSGAILLVTHDRYFLNRVSNRILELERGKLYAYDGNYETFLEKKAEREEEAASAEQKRQNLLRRELAWLRRGAQARSTKQKARIQRVEDIQSQKLSVANDQLDIAIGSNRLGKKVLELKEVSLRFGAKRLFENFSYLVVPTERLGIIGPNGSGKSSLLNLMAGRLAPESGTLETGSTVKIGYYTQENVEMNTQLRVIEYIKETAENVRTVDGQIITAEQMLERFLFSRTMQWTYISKLSGGERRRLYLLHTLMEEPNVLFLDEPTNDLDTETLAVLEEYLDVFPGVVITVSHDRYFLDRVVDHLLVFEGDGGISRFEGNYSEYLERRKAEKRAAAEGGREESRQDAGGAPKKERRRKLSYKEQREWEEIEGRIAALEARQGEIAHELEAAASDSGRVQSLFAEQQRVDEELEQAIERWTELSLLMEELEQQ